MISRRLRFGAFFFACSALVGTLALSADQPAAPTAPPPAIVLYGVSLEPARSPGRESKTISHLEDGGRKLIHRQFSVGGGEGKDRLVMELILTRKK
jgi:hypothetical protein